MAIFQAFTYNLPFKDDLLPRIYLARGDTNQAVIEYERITRVNPEDKDRRFIPNIFNYRLARLYEQSGQRQKAIDRYNLFLDIWKNADKDLPELVDAQLRLEALNSPKSKIQNQISGT